MYYYAIINEEYTVMEVVSSSTIINDVYYIEITEEQYNDEGFLGMFYDQDKDEFGGAVMWMGTTNEVRYDETYRTLTGKLNEMDEDIATHTHAGYVSIDDLQALEDNLQTLEDVIDTKANINHTHDSYANASHSHNDVYYTETEIDTKLATKADSSHNHTGIYDASGAAANALTSANTYTDEAIDTLSETVATKANTYALTSHTGNTAVHVTEANKTNWNAAKTHADSAHAPTTNATQTSSGLMSASDKSKLDGMVLATVSEVETYLEI